MHLDGGRPVIARGGAASVPGRALRSRWLRVLAVLAVLAVVLAVLSFLPPVQARTKSLVAMADSLGVDLPRPFAPDTQRRAVRLGGVPGHLYSPPEPAPGVVVVPGATREGKYDKRVVRLARALTRAHRAVFVPELALYRHEIAASDVSRIVRAAAALEEHPKAEDGKGVVLLGFSYGGSYALVAAADPRVRADVRLVATFGSYFDIVGLVQGASTHTTTVGGRRYGWQPHPYVGEVLREIATELVRPGRREKLVAALERELPPTQLASGPRAVYELVTNRDPARTRHLVARLSPHSRRVLDQLSPSAVAGHIAAPVLAMHTRNDPFVPYAELRRLERAMPAATTLGVSSFRHVNLRAENIRQLAGDLLTVWGFASRVIRTQE